MNKFIFSKVSELPFIFTFKEFHLRLYCQIDKAAFYHFKVSERINNLAPPCHLVVPGNIFEDALGSNLLNLMIQKT